MKADSLSHSESKHELETYMVGEKIQVLKDDAGLRMKNA